MRKVGESMEIEGAPETRPDTGVLLVNWKVNVLHVVFMHRKPNLALLV